MVWVCLFPACVGSWTLLRPFLNLCVPISYQIFNDFSRTADHNIDRFFPVSTPAHRIFFKITVIILFIPEYRFRPVPEMSHCLLGIQFRDHDDFFVIRRFNAETVLQHCSNDNICFYSCSLSAISLFMKTLYFATAPAFFQWLESFSIPTQMNLVLFLFLRRRTFAWSASYPYRAGSVCKMFSSDCLSSL